MDGGDEGSLAATIRGTDSGDEGAVPCPPETTFKEVEEVLEIVLGRERDFAAVREHVECLEKHRAMIHYADLTAAGLPIGSRIVESINKLVVEARLKGAAKSWERAL